MTEVELTSSATGMAAAATGMATQSLHRSDTASFEPTMGPGDELPVGAGDDKARARRRVALLVALMIGVPLAALGIVVAWLRTPGTAVAPIDESQRSAPVSTRAASHRPRRRH